MLTRKKLEKAFLEWGKDLYAFAYIRLSNQSLAEDIVQEAFVKAWRSRDTFDKNKASLKTWLFTITRNAIIDHIKSQKIQIETDCNLENLPSDLNENTNLDKQILSDKVYRQLSKLSDREQELILLRYKSDLKVKEIAALLGLSLPATKVALHRALDHLSTICKKIL